MSAKTPVTPPQSPDALPVVPHYVPTSLYLVSGKKANAQFRSALQAHREANKENIPPPLLKHEDATLQEEEDLTASQILPQKDSEHHVDEKKR